MLIITPWMLLAIAWSAGIFCLMPSGSLEENIISAIKGLCLAVWLAGVGLGFRQGMPALIKTLRDWFERLDKWMYIHTP